MRTPKDRRWIRLQFDEMLYVLKGRAKDEPRALEGAEDVRGCREGTSLDVFKQQGGTPRFVHTTVNLRHLKHGVHLVGHPNQVTFTFEVFETMTKALIAHFDSDSEGICLGFCYLRRSFR